MEEMRIGDLNDAIRSAIEKFADKQAFTNLRNSESFTYSEVGDYIAGFHNLFKSASIDEGDKIALCAPNSSQWSIVFLSTIAYGAVSVPILNEFTPSDVEKLVAHSESKILFTTEQIFGQIDMTKLPEVRLVFDTENNFRCLFAKENLEKIVPAGIGDDKNGVGKLQEYLPSFPDSKLALINYTSGSTGNPKGVMLSRRAIISNLQFAIDYMPFLKAEDGILSMLPLAHMYGMLVEMIFPFAVGAHICFLGRTPSPQILLASFAKVKPRLIITVPLVIEKIIITRVFPQLKKGLLSVLYKCPGINILIKKNIRNKLLKVFGGNLYEMIIGGSALNPHVEKFLTEIKFPFTVGYGMTECAPLISYAPWNNRTIGSCGRIVDRMEAKIESPDPYKIPGELLVKGHNVMEGYFHNEDASNQIFDKDGWMRTGDIVELDRKGLFHIKGRSKTMILGSSGQNIYPEEIEAKLNRMPYVAESLIVGRDNRLVALIVVDSEAAEKNGLSPEGVDEAMKSNIDELNKEMPVYSKISGYEILDQPFEKTPKHSIKRFLYS